MSKQRREAIDRVCQIRLDGCNTQPCCLCHFRVMGISGIGMKSPDILGSWGCMSCHRKVDTTERGDVQTQLDFAKGVFRTIAILVDEGKIKYE